MTNFFFQLGSFPALSREEIRHVFPVFSEKPINGSTILTGSFNAALSSEKKEEWQRRFNELGGSIRCGRILAEGSQKSELTALMTAVLEEKARTFGKKIQFGITLAQNDKTSLRDLKTLLIGVKKEGRNRNLSLRFINRNFQNIDAGTYFKEDLFREEYPEFFIFESEGKWTLAETLAAQRVEDFAARDYGKPVRDMNVGMLPPKLALMMVNFARDEEGNFPERIWDPFCGTGTILIEATRLGLESFGSDIDPRMVEAARRNLQSLFPAFDPENVIRHDVTTDLAGPIRKHVIVAEGYLGPIFHRPLVQSQFLKAESEIIPLYESFFAHIPAPTEKIILAVPFWRGQGNGYFYLEKILETAGRFGYTSQAFFHGTKRGSLEFLRGNQVVGREIFRFVRK